MMTAVPQAIVRKLETHFQFPEKRVFGQLATQSGAGPHIRTMRLYRVTEEGCLALLSHTETQKWKDMEGDPNVSVCFFEGNTQIIVSGSVRLHAGEESRELLEGYWEALPLSSRKIYSDTESEKLPGTLGLIFIIPKTWEMLELDAHYPSSVRCLFSAEAGGWKKWGIPVKS